MIELKNNDILIFKNGNRIIYNKHKEWIIQQYYDSELNCITNDDYSITRIYRPSYQLILKKDKTKEK